MWQIRLLNIDNDGLEVICTTPVDTLPEAEIIAVQAIQNHLGIQSIEIDSRGNLLYDVWHGINNVGVVAIKTL